MSYNNNKAYIATGSSDCSVKLWLRYKSILVNTFYGHTARLNCVNFSPDSEFLVSGSDDSTVVVRRISTGIVHNQPINLKDKVISVIFGNESNFVYAGTAGGKLLAIDNNTGKIVNKTTFNGYKIVKLVAHKQSNKLIVALAKNTGADNPEEFGSLLLTDMDGFNNNIILSGYKENINGFCLSPDSSRIITASSNGMIRVWNTAKYIEEISIKNSNPAISEVFMSVNNKMIGVTGQNNSTVYMWRITGEKLFDFDFGEGHAVSGEFNDDITRVHICSSTGKFIIYDLNGRERETIGDYGMRKSPLTKITESSGKIIFGHKNGGLYGFNLTTLQYFKVPVPQSSAILSMCMSPNGKILAISNDHVLLFQDDNKDVTTGNSCISFIDTDKGIIIKSIPFKDIYCTALTVTDSFCYAGFSNGLLNIYNINSFNEVNSIQAHDYDLTGIIVSENTGFAATSSVDATIKVWKLNNNKPVLYKMFGFENEILNLNFISSEQTLIANIKNEGIYIIRNFDFDNAKKNKIHFETSGMAINITDSLMLISARKNLTECHAYSLSTAEEKWNFIHPAPGIIYLGYLDEYNLFMSCLENREIVLIREGKEIARIFLPGDEKWYAISAEGSFCTSQNALQEVRLFDNLNIKSNEDLNKYLNNRLLENILIKK